MGGGLGHLTRARAFLYTAKIKNAVILTSSPFASDRRVVSDFKVIQVDKAYEKNVPAFQDRLRNIFSDPGIKTLYIDSFPLGIIGELSGFEFSENLEINYLARLLKWKNYSHFLPKKFPRFNKTFILEPLESEHQKFIDASSAAQFEIELKYPEFNLNSADEKTFRLIVNEKKPFWLVVHSGNETETTELIAYARQMREIEKAAVNLILISPHDFAFQTRDLLQFNIYPAAVLYEFAERIFSACGFNAMRQTAGLRERHRFIPFERRYDDQYARAKQFR